MAHRPMRARVQVNAATSLALAIVLGFMSNPSPVLAGGPIRVTTQADTLASDGACSLREAIRAANLDVRVDACRAGRGADTIRLPGGTFKLAIAGPNEDAALSGDLDITNDLSIEGAGRGRTIVDADSLDRVVDILAPARVSLTRLTITGGYLATGERMDGAGIANAGTLTLDSARIANNVVYHDPGGMGGGIYSTGRLVMTGSAVTGNSSAGAGGIQSSGVAWLDHVEISGNSNTGPITGDPGDAGGISSTGYLVLSRSLVTGNDGTEEWGTGGVVMARGIVVGTTISGNTARDCGTGGIEMSDAVLLSSTVSDNIAGGCGHPGGVLAVRSTIIASTISGNSLYDGFAYGAAGIEAIDTRIISSTITANTLDGEMSSGLVAGLMGLGTTTIAGSIVAGNAGGGVPSDCGGTLASSGRNLVGGPAACDLVPTASDLVGVDPRLGPLADNGGPTETHALLRGSPAIDAYTCKRRDAGPCLVAVDQRGVRRPQDGDRDGRKGFDIGSVEMRRR